MTVINSKIILTVRAVVFHVGCNVALLLNIKQKKQERVV